MFAIYSLILAIGFLLMLPLFMLRREKYAAGLLERLGRYTDFNRNERPVIWIHCVSVGETNAAQPLFDEIRRQFPAWRIVISTTTKTGRKLAQTLYGSEADAIFYFPFDFKFSVRRSLSVYKPAVILLMETEIWPRFIREAKQSGAQIAVVNGRLSEKSAARYARFGLLIRKTFADIDLVIMQSDDDAARVARLGIDPAKVKVTGNVKLDRTPAPRDRFLAAELRERFGYSDESILIVAASTHETEERLVLEALAGEIGRSCRMLIAPRHPDRFDSVAAQIAKSGFSMARRSSPPSASDATAQVVLLDTIGELRAVYNMADIVFVGGSLIPHGGQSIIEPALAGCAVITGPFTANFHAAMSAMIEQNAIRQIARGGRMSETLRSQFVELIENPLERQRVGQAALDVTRKMNQNASRRTIEELAVLLYAKPSA